MSHEFPIVFSGAREIPAKNSQHLFDILSGHPDIAHQDRMPAPGVDIQLLQAGDESGSNGVEVEISDILQELAHFTANDRFVPILEEVAGPAGKSIETDGMGCEEAFHQGMQRRIGHANQKVKVIRQEGPCEEGCVEFIQEKGETAQKEGPVGFIEENRATLDPSRHHMLDESRLVDAGSSWHARNMQKG